MCCSTGVIKGVTLPYIPNEELGCHLVTQICMLGDCGGPTYRMLISDGQ